MAVTAIPFALVVADAILRSREDGSARVVRLTAGLVGAIVGGSLLVLGPWYSCGSVALPMRLAVSLVAGLIAATGYLIARRAAVTAFRPRPMGERLALLGASWASVIASCFVLAWVYLAFVAPAYACAP